MSDDLAINRRYWDELAELHEHSAFYDVEGFGRGATSLRPLEIAELGDVSGRTMLHLQCHIGLDTLSWARMGAEVTGVDFSEKSIAIARRIASNAGVEARFIQSDIYELPSVLDERFDIVFTSHGVLMWLPDIRAWGELIARYLAPGGTFYVLDVHPVLRTLAERDGRIVVGRAAYFDDEPDRREAPSYAEPDATLVNPLRVHWMHGLGDIVSSLAAAGLHIEFLHEHPVLSYQLFGSMVQDGAGWWRLPGADEIPLMFSLKARG